MEDSIGRDAEGLAARRRRRDRVSRVIPLDPQCLARNARPAATPGGVSAIARSMTRYGASAAGDTRKSKQFSPSSALRGRTSCA
jgi:hypothetical protein